MPTIFNQLLSWGAAGLILIFGFLLLIFAFAQGRQILSSRLVSVSELLNGKVGCIKGQVKPLAPILSSPLGKVKSVYWQILIETAQGHIRGTSWAIVDEKIMGDRFLIGDQTAEIPVHFREPREGLSVDSLALSKDLCTYQDQRSFIQPFARQQSASYLKERSQLKQLKYSQKWSLRISEMAICEGQELFVWGSLAKNAEGQPYFLASMISDRSSWQQRLKALGALLAGLFLIQLGLGIF